MNVIGSRSNYSWNLDEVRVKQYFSSSGFCKSIQVAGYCCFSPNINLD